jgi:hypothetical protein
VVVRDEDLLETDRVLNDLMGKDPRPRFKFITDKGAEAELDV